MAIQGLMFRFCNFVGYGYKSPLCFRLLAPLHQQTAGVKSIESKLGLPSKPKRPVGPFLRFTQTMRPKLLAENPGLKQTEIVKELSAKWKVCDPAIKKKLTEESQKCAEEYAAALEKYHLSLSKEDHEVIREAKAKVKETREARAHRKKLKMLNKPKRPLNSYMLFLAEEDAKGTFEGLPPPERFKKGGKMWTNAPESVAAKFREKAAAAYQQYKLDLEAWEERMVSSGYVDVIHDSPSKLKKKT